jgi:galactose-1-phosphate uridylyltransferase
MMEPLLFQVETLQSRIVAPEGTPVEKPVEIRTDPISGRTCRITFARAAEKETGTAALPEPPPAANAQADCPFCRPQLTRRTPTLPDSLAETARLEEGGAILFPNLFPYGRYSAVSLFDNRHFVEIGKASRQSYVDSFRNCRHYLEKVLAADPAAVYMAITQNHLPSAGGSLVHPHLQVHADRYPPNYLRFLENRANTYAAGTRRGLFADYLAHEQADGSRMIGQIGDWQWLAAFAPEGFFEIWGILPQVHSLLELDEKTWESLAEGVLNTQQFYRSLHRNGYNLGVLSVENSASCLELRIRILARSNYAPWVRNDHTGYEVMLGDMATFNAPEETAQLARPFWRA